MRVTLRVTAGPHEGREFTFTGHDTFMVGRSQRAHFRLTAKDRYFSRFHFLVEVNPPQCRLLDMGSRNGTSVNGVKVKAADLRDGDEIRAGKTVLRVALEAPAESASVAEPEPLAPAAESAAAALPWGWVDTVFPASGAAERLPAPAAESCPACTTPLSFFGTVAPENRSPAPGPLLCPPCHDGSERLEQRVTGYRLVRKLGSGGMGVVYLALHTAGGGRLCALKTIKPAAGATPHAVERFLREASILRALDHPHIVAFRDMGSSSGLVYFAMDYARGTDAAALLNARGPLPVGRAVGLVCQVLEALEYAHARRFVHRDIKPANVLLTEEGGREVAKLADFGLARVYEASTISGLTMTRDVGGTPAFMPPEQITDYRNVTPAADQYSAAAMLYTLLTGRFIFDLPDDLNGQYGMILRDEPVPIRSRCRDIPKGLAQAIHRALEKAAERRFPSVEILRQALRPFQCNPHPEI
jgi:serine/threonine-protein kinase